MYDFSKVINRRGTHSFKWDRLGSIFGNPDLLAMWVADMDWETPAFIKDAITNQVEQSPVLGYTCDPDEWWPTVLGWIKDHHQWEVQREWITYVPGVVRGLAMVINKFLKPGDKVIVQPPVYHPFFNTPKGNNYEVVWNPLIENLDAYAKDPSQLPYLMDFDDLERKCDDKCRLLVLANPHNPVGVTWDKETLQRLAVFAKEHNLIVVSDEIHCDLALYGNKHIPFATVCPEAAEVSITFSAPSKTFNMAGVVSSWVIVPNPELRESFFSWMEANEFCEAHMFAPVATVAALSQGEPWRKEMLEYLEGNIDYLIDYCAERLPQIRPIRPQASYLVWLDCRELGLSHDDLLKLFIEKAGIAVNPGFMFGEQGEGFMRLNVGCSRATITEALQRLEKAVKG